MAIVSKQSFILADASKKRGPLVRVEISPGRFVKMYQEDAVAAGHIKVKPPAENKIRLPQGDKAAGEQGGRGARPIARQATPENAQALRTGVMDIELPGQNAEGAAEQKQDDFTAIPGVGPATARALQARGITTLEQLRQAGTLDYVSIQAMQAIERWREKYGSAD